MRGKKVEKACCVISRRRLSLKDRKESWIWVEEIVRSRENMCKTGKDESQLWVSKTILSRAVNDARKDHDQSRFMEHANVCMERQWDLPCFKEGHVLENTQNEESSHYIKFDKNKQKFYCTFSMSQLQHWVLGLQKVWQITLHRSNISLINKHMKTPGSEHS